ncbi:unnamed protein product [Effrenium voratum]|nr:unnamed protein product [Effrenium voratum]
MPTKRLYENYCGKRSLRGSCAGSSGSWNSWRSQRGGLAQYPAASAKATSAAPFAGPARACEVLELLCRGQEELTTLLHRQHVLLAVSSRLLAATAAQPAPNWRPYAALMVGLLEALMAEKDTERFRLADPALFIPVWSCRRQEVTRQALLAVLEEGGATMLHASALRALTHLAKHSSSEAAMLRRHAGLGGVCSREKLVIALEFLVTVRAKADDTIIVKGRNGWPDQLFRVVYNQIPEELEAQLTTPFTEEQRQQIFREVGLHSAERKTAPSRPKALLVFGPPAVGKSTLSMEVAKKLFESPRNVVSVDGNDVRDRHAGFNKVAQHGFKHKLLHADAWDKLKGTKYVENLKKEILSLAVQNRQDVIIPECAMQPERVHKMLRQMENADYEMHAICLWAPLDAVQHRGRQRSVKAGKAFNVKFHGPSCAGAVEFGKHFEKKIKESSRHYGSLICYDNTIKPSHPVHLAEFEHLTQMSPEQTQEHVRNCMLARAAYHKPGMTKAELSRLSPASAHVEPGESLPSGSPHVSARIAAMLQARPLWCVAVGKGFSWGSPLPGRLAPGDPLRGVPDQRAGTRVYEAALGSVKAVARCDATRAIPTPGMRVHMRPREESEIPDLCGRRQHNALNPAFDGAKHRGGWIAADAVGASSLQEAKAFSMAMLKALSVVALFAACDAARTGKGLALLSPLDEEAWRNVKVTDVKPGFHVEVLESQACSQQVRRGDAVSVHFSAATGPQHVEQASSVGVAEQNFIVGKHNIPAVNKGMKGMCPGDSRRISVESHGIDYTVKLLSIESGPLRIKAA